MLTDASPFEVHAETQPLSKTVLDRVLWPLFLLLAWLVFELTASAMLSLTLGCLKFGTNDFRTAWWLWQTDPLRPRARACASFYLASGVWKTALVPLLTVAVVVVLWVMVGSLEEKQAQPMTTHLMRAMQVGGAAAAIFMLLAGAAALLAWRAPWRVWVHPALHRYRRAGSWPPRFSLTDHPQANQAMLIMLTAIFAATIIGPVVTLLVINLLHVPVALRHVAELLVVFGYPILGVLAVGLLRGKLFAESPWECWPESLRELQVTQEPSKTSQ